MDSHSDARFVSINHDGAIRGRRKTNGNIVSAIVGAGFMPPPITGGDKPRTLRTRWPKRQQSIVKMLTNINKY
jgi:hypothetical protein